ncbi:MAG: hypothetical protein IBX69_06140 [Anaerolineales bacterium]|nr:hypothetical protein [Anaerolineales bacterium]
MKRSIFERYGGFAKVNRIVSSFYDKVLDSPITSPYFVNIDMRRLIDHQTRFIASLDYGWSGKLHKRSVGACPCSPRDN